MHDRIVRFAVLTLMFGCSATAFAQALPTTQPALLTIYREEVKLGRSADHEKHEMGWPAAFEKANSPYYYLAMESMTGPAEAWYISPFESHAAIADSLKREATDPVLAAELARLNRADAELLNSLRTYQARARLDLSMGSFPDLAKMRFWEITWFRVRPGHEASFEAAAKAYAAAAKRGAPDTRFRVYEVIAGGLGPTYLVFSSVASYAEFDQLMAAGDKVMQSFSAEEGATMQRFFKEGCVNFETNRFKLNPAMSYVAKETRAQDPAFWMPKKPAAKTSQP